jgi:RNA polymerase sigma-70 factor, ECF subfamily
MLELLRNQAPPTAGWDWEELSRTAMAVAAEVLRSRHDAEDAAQEAILRAWRARTHCAGAENPCPWVGRIAHNEALRLGTRISARRRAEGGELNEDCTGPERSGGPETAAGTVITALAGLPPSDRELVRLRYVEDLHYSTIAERLSLPLGTVKVRLHRVHRRLRNVGKR